jgi:hypothetical protein
MGKKKLFVFDKRQNRMVPMGSQLKDVEAPFVQDDTIPPTLSHATDEGLVFDSRSKLNEHYRQHGFECTGGDHLTGKMFTGETGKVFDSEAERSRKAEWGMLNIDPEIRALALEARRKAKWGMAPLSEREKESCLREERIYQEYRKRQY